MDEERNLHDTVFEHLDDLASASDGRTPTVRDITKRFAFISRIDAAILLSIWQAGRNITTPCPRCGQLLRYDTPTLCDACRQA
jgi:hypothetical protein